MKRNWFCVVGTAVLLSGCAPMMYDGNTAPVVRLNQGQLQPQLPQVQNRPLSHGQIVALTPTYAPPPRAVRPTMPVSPQVVGAVPNVPAATQVTAPSPYAQPGTAQPYQPQGSGNNDGWAVVPQTSNNTQGQTDVGSPAQNGAQPMRPNVNANERNTAAQSTGNNAAVANPPQAVPNNANNSNQQVASSAPPQSAATNQDKSAVSVLIDKASASLGKGDLDGAAAYLENAQRIEPHNVKILYDIANIRYHQGRYKDAETFAARAVGEGGGSAMMQKTWKLISLSRAKLGDNQGAVAAAERAASFGN